MNRSKWLFNPYTDILLLGLPVWLTWVACFYMPQSMLDTKLPLWMWLSVILLVDVSHVWSTIFRTYFDKDEFQQHKTALTITPLLVVVIVFGVCMISPFLFWRLLAYFALYHFMKQQYGFLALYSHKFGVRIPKKIFKDKWVVFFSMLYPVFFWHVHYDRKFNWFVDNDFFNLESLLGLNREEVGMVFTVLNILYFVVMFAWLIEDVVQSKKLREPLAIGKVIWMFSTSLNWYLGIVYFNSDIAFTLTNCVAHGLPYIVLVFHYVEKKKEIKQGKPRTSFNWIKAISFMLIAILLFAFIEEYFWDMFINREKQPIFESLFAYPFEQLNINYLQALTVALLSVPQITHYVIDGMIWKSNHKNPFLKPIFFGSNK